MGSLTPPQKKVVVLIYCLSMCKKAQISRSPTRRKFAKSGHTLFAFLNLMKVLMALT
jgi:hypothetical protein